MSVRRPFVRQRTCKAMSILLRFLTISSSLTAAIVCNVCDACLVRRGSTACKACVVSIAWRMQCMQLEGWSALSRTIWARAVVNACQIGLHKRPEKAIFDHIFYKASLRGYNGLALHCRAGPRCARAKKFLYLNLFIFIIYIMRHYQDR